MNNIGVNDSSGPVFQSFFGSEITAEDSVFRSNSAPGGQGGVAFLQRRSKFTCKNCLFEQNHADTGGCFYLA